MTQVLCNRCGKKVEESACKSLSSNGELWRIELKDPEGYYLNLGFGMEKANSDVLLCPDCLIMLLCGRFPAALPAV